MDARPESTAEAAAPGERLATLERRDLLRLLTCGSVDDGKSTLIGRLLHDSAALFDDQLARARREPSRPGSAGGDIDFASLLDGLAAEQEQGITIDVAYRTFSTPRRKFILADAPGHEQYTRNMVTGASNADLALILVDAERGVRPQTRRHAFIASLLGIRHLVVAVNKMDRVAWSEPRFAELRQELGEFAARLQVADLHFLPISALHGDNVVTASERMPWYRGGPLLELLETVHIASDRNLIDLRFPVQLVLRPPEAGRLYAGSVASGILRPGEDLLVLPSGQRTRVASLETADGRQEEARPPEAVTVRLQPEVDVSRGDMLVPVANVPQLTPSLEATVVWMGDRPLRPGGRWLLKHTTARTTATAVDLRYRIDVTTLHREPAGELRLNEIGRVRFECARPLAVDPYRRNRVTGSFILVDGEDFQTVGAGLVLDRSTGEEVFGARRAVDAGRDLRRGRQSRVDPAARARRLGQTPFCLWLTGLPRSGKSSLAFGLEEELFRRGLFPAVIDGEDLRAGVNADLGFAPRDRTENVRRAAELARLLLDQGLVVIVALVSPTAEDRDLARRRVGPERFAEVYCRASLAACEARDKEGLFARARSGKIAGVTGIDAPYEPPAAADLELDTEGAGVDENVARLLEELGRRGWSGPGAG